MAELIHFRQSTCTDIVLHRGKVVPASIPAKIAAWLLSKTKHHVVTEHPRSTITYNTFNADDARSMIQALFDHRACRMAYDDEIDRIIVGRSHFEKILQHDIDHPFGASVDMVFWCGGHAKLMGIYVQCVPWIDGFAIIPKKDVP